MSEIKEAPSSADPATPRQLKKVFIVIQETPGDGTGIQLFMGGDIERIGKVPDKDLTAAEFWGNACFGTAVKLLRDSGVIAPPQVPKKSIIEV